MVGTSQQGDRYVARANGGLSNHVKNTCRSRAGRSTLIKAQLSAHNVATERGTSDKTEATCFSQCALELMVDSATMSQSHGAELIVVL